MKRYCVIVAGGSGVRMGSILPKQFMLLGDLPMLMHSIKAFENCSVTEIIVVIPLPFIDYWNSLCNEYSFSIPHTVVAGGLFRSQSVKNGIDMIKEEEAIVAIHDGVRPLVEPELVKQAFTVAENKGSAVPYINLHDSIRYVTDSENNSVDRDRYKIIQTPQCFSLSILKKVYYTNRITSFTDDSSMVEKLGIRVNLFKGSESNIKITSPLDMIIAEAILNHRLSPANY